MELGTIVKEYEYEEAFKYAKENGYSIKEVEATDLEVMETETYFENEEIEEIIQEKRDAEYDEDGNIVVEASDEIREKRIEVVEKTREVPKIITVRQFKIVEIPKYEPTNEDISKMRQSAYAERTDPLTLRKMRKLALGEWTDEDETQYVSEIQAISQQIAKEYPYKEQ